MVHRFQEEDNYDNYDPVPYQGGYDQAAAYGSVKPADEESGYRRADFGEDEEEQEVQYGNESNPYGRGPPGPSIYGGRPTTGGVYGGGRDRTRPDPDEAQPDEGVETGYGRRKPAYEGEEEEGYNKPSYGGEEEEGYSKPTYGGEEEESGYRKPRPTYGEEEESGYRKPRPTYGEEESEESGYRQPRPPYSEGATEESEYRQSRYERQERPYGGKEAPAEEEGYGGGYGRKKYGEETDEGGYGGGYGRAEEGGYGGYRPRRNEEEEPAEEKKSWW